MTRQQTTAHGEPLKPIKYNQCRERSRSVDYLMNMCSKSSLYLGPRRHPPLFQCPECAGEGMSPKPVVAELGIVLGIVQVVVLVLVLVVRK